MSIVLQHIRSSLYFHGPGSWTRELCEAFDFRHSQRAMDYARQQRFAGVQVIIVFIDGERIETHIFPIESPPQMPALASVAGIARQIENRSTHSQGALGCEL